LILKEAIHGHRVGEEQPRAKLTEAKVRQMRKERAEGAKVKDLASRYGVSISTVSAICQHLSWSHVR
jgi:uncharacterized protein YjcR